MHPNKSSGKKDVISNRGQRRTIVIDGCNVAYSHGRHDMFSGILNISVAIHGNLSSPNVIIIADISTYSFQRKGLRLYTTNSFKKDGKTLKYIYL